MSYSASDVATAIVEVSGSVVIEAARAVPGRLLDHTVLPLGADKTCNMENQALLGGHHHAHALT